MTKKEKLPLIELSGDFTATNLQSPTNKPLINHHPGKTIKISRILSDYLDLFGILLSPAWRAGELPNRYE
jgi:hypothetical protein